MSVANVVFLAFVGVCLPFKTDIEISLFNVETVLHQTHQKFCTVPQIEQHVSHLPLLVGVDELVIQFMRLHLAPSLLYEDGAKEVQSVVGAEGDETVVDDFHGDKVTDFSLQSHIEVG